MGTRWLKRAMPILCCIARVGPGAVPTGGAESRVDGIEALMNVRGSGAELVYEVGRNLAAIPL
jgi:hypothetical protein